MENPLHDFVRSLGEPHNLGPLTKGHYISVGAGLGFFVDEAAYQLCQRAANVTGKIEFLGVGKDGSILRGTRDEIAGHPLSSGCIAWIGPDRSLPECKVCHYLGDTHAPGCVV